jgi:hypothetical protein
VLRFANEIEDGGMEWPKTDVVGAEGWHYQLRATMAAAIEALIKVPGRKGGAVMSNIETAQIIQFADAARPKRRPVANHSPSVAKNEEGVSDTAGNQRLRSNRRDVWREAAAVTCSSLAWAGRRVGCYAPRRDVLLVYSDIVPGRGPEIGVLSGCSVRSRTCGGTSVSGK